MRSALKFAQLLFIAVLLGQAGWTVFADASTLTEDQYWALVQESRDEIARLKNASAEEISLGMEQLAARWEAVTEVEVDGKRIPVDHQYLTEMMRTNPPDLERLDELLASFLDAKRVAPIGAFSSADLAPLKEILSRPEFQWAEAAPNPAMEWIQKIFDTIIGWLNKILGITLDAADSNVTTFIMAALLAAVFIFVFRTLFADFLNEAKMNGENEEEPLTSESAFAKAQRLSRGGDYRAAVRYLYLSTLLILDERGVMRYDRSKTNREYLRSVSNSPELSKPLEEVIEVFDNVWYGYHTLEEDTFKHYSDRVEELKEKRS
ncbi:MAG: DUF4129 domain-containing protein [Chloroflexi bacterium]|nr:DUF4129 domain-containing protein [Chloroflexota bacterium]